MNDKKLNRLFTAARNQSAPTPAPDFANNVLRAARNEPAAKAGESFSLFDQLNALFPRIAVAAAVVIALCVATELMSGLPELGDGAAQVSSQFVFDAENL